MRCGKCGKDFNAGLSQCPYCQAPVHYGGNTTFYGNAVNNELSLKDFFVNIFSAQPPGVGDKMFASGTALTTPTPDRMLQEWNKPWLYARVLLIGLLFDFMCHILFGKQGNSSGIYMLFSFGSLVVPLSILIFYWEINIPRDIPLYRVIMIFFVGGTLSLIFTLLLPNTGGPAYLAPLTEEPGKVLALAIFIYWLDARYIFGGLLIGAAVGAGFAAFEDVMYVMRTGIISMLSVFEDLMKGTIAIPDQYSKDVQGLLKFLYDIMYMTGSENLIARSVLTLGGHVTWAAIEGGALVMAKGNDQLKSNHFFDPRFLAYLGSAMAMHWAWNYPYQLHPMPYVIDAKYLILIAIAVFVAFTLIQRAVLQVLEVANTAVAQPSVSAAANNVLMLKATSGPLVNALFPVEQMLTFGRDPAMCNVVFPSNTPGISRRHCVLKPHSGELYLMDLGSMAGTFLQNGQRLQPNQWIKVTSNFYLGSTNAMFAINRSSGNLQGNLPPAPINPPLPPSNQPPVSPAMNTVSIVGVTGPMQGRNFSDPQRLVIGREPTQCNVLLPPRTPGVSRRHCILERRADGVYIMDVGSSAGTFLQNGQRLQPNQWVKVTGNFYLGSPNVTFAVT